MALLLWNLNKQRTNKQRKNPIGTISALKKLWTTKPICKDQLYVPMLAPKIWTIKFKIIIIVSKASNT